ncbi:hypothetical protein [Methanoregula sp. UBA64]|jgi:hypothetical protein|uniref:hypothetical protein n=1 Tax=Methanoregula sp. UBA64 TaxID=1915554 RepID=UPI0025E6CB04|nr:hypothetical protein [Methanoregula sp. UBA64]
MLPETEPVHDIESMYHRKNGKVMIEIKLSSIPQLFNSFDPSPFYEKEIDTSAEQYIVDTVKDFPAKTQFGILIYLPAGKSDCTEAQKIIPAIHTHFAYRALATDRKLRARFRFGRWALLVGLSFMVIAMIARQFAGALHNQFLAQLLSDALLIIGWAAMWEPITVLLYQLWPIVKEKKIYEKISRMEIEILPVKE